MFLLRVVITMLVLCCVRSFSLFQFFLGQIITLKTFVHKLTTSFEAKSE